MLTVHHLSQSRSKRVLWLLEELQMPYLRIDYFRDSTTQLAPESMKAIHPLGKAPIIVDGDITLCESGAVMAYILDQDTKQRLRPKKDNLLFRNRLVAVYVDQSGCVQCHRARRFA